MLLPMMIIIVSNDNDGKILSDWLYKRLARVRDGGGDGDDIVYAIHTQHAIRPAAPTVWVHYNNAVRLHKASRLQCILLRSSI